VKSNRIIPKKIPKKMRMSGYIIIVLSVLSLSLVYVNNIFISINMTVTALPYTMQNVYGLSADNASLGPSAFLIYGNQKYEMSPFVLYDGKDLHKILYPSADVDPVLAVQQGGKIGIEFSEEPTSVNAYIADYEADAPSLHSLKELSKNRFELSGVQGVWNIEVHATFPNNNGLSSRYASFELGIDMMPKASIKSIRSIDQNLCAVNDIGIARVSGGAGQQQYNSKSISNDPSTNTLNYSVSNNILTIGSMYGRSSSFTIGLGQEKTVCTLNLLFGNGDRVVNHFTIQTSTDGIHFSKPVSYDNTAAIAGEESYDFSSVFPITTRYAKITFEGNTQGNVYSLLQAKILGNN
jgi:hypothetical protein